MIARQQGLGRCSLDVEVMPLKTGLWGNSSMQPEDISVFRYVFHPDDPGPWERSKWAAISPLAFGDKGRAVGRGQEGQDSGRMHADYVSASQKEYKGA